MKKRTALIKEKIIGKSSEEITDYLLSVPLKESGGLTAISGFYYQFLVTIEYFIELLEKKWDFLAIELHDDIIVGKDKEIRFIQVKSSYKPTQNPSDVSEFYNRELKKRE
ncbi:dsDNA nuclease domain-containing protein [Bacillus pacificus]